jgi:hypothetical protein
MVLNLVFCSATFSNKMDCHYSVAQGTDREAEMCSPSPLWNQDHSLPYPPGDRSLDSQVNKWKESSLSRPIYSRTISVLSSYLYLALTLWCLDLSQKSIYRHSLTYRISSYIILEAVKKLNCNNFQNKSQVFPCRVKVQWDKVVEEYC